MRSKIAAFSVFLILMSLLNTIFEAKELKRFREGETKSYSIKKAGVEAGYSKFKVNKVEKGFYLIEGETYFELSKERGIIKHFKEKLTLSRELRPVNYSLEILSHPQPIKSVEANVMGDSITLTYSITSGEGIIKDEKKVSVPAGNLAILDSDVIEHLIILFKKYDFSAKKEQEIISFNPLAGGASGKLLLVFSGRESIKIGDRDYQCHRVSVQLEGKNFFNGWIEVKSGDVLKVADSSGILRNCNF